MWSKFYHDGGWGMYPVTVFGLLLIIFCVLNVIRPEARWLRLSQLWALLTMGAGLLGTSVGMCNTFLFLTQVPKSDQLEVAAIGCQESLHNLILALLLLIIAGLVSVASVLRSSPRPCCCASGTHSSSSS